MWRGLLTEALSSLTDFAFLPAFKPSNKLLGYFQSSLAGRFLRALLK